jgi:hypothetical protein
MPSERDDKDIEIIPPDRSRRDGRTEWVYVSSDGTAKTFKDLPLHKRLLLGAAWLAGAVLLGVIVFLVVASAVLIWIPLLLAIAVITGLVMFFRTKLRRR